MDYPKNAILSWHFVGSALRDGSPVPADGEVLTHQGDVNLCVSGYHASRRIIDALFYAPGCTLCRVAVWGDVQSSDDKLVGRNRMILWRVDAEETLREFARKQALSVAHLWDMPDVVRRYLETGDESLLAEARGRIRAAQREIAASMATVAMPWDEQKEAATKAAAGVAVWSVLWYSPLHAARFGVWCSGRDGADEMLTAMVMQLQDKE